MTVRVEKPSVNLREKLAELDKPTGIAGEAMLRAETPQEQFNLIGAGRRNLLINGDMRIAQAATSISVIGTGSYQSVDRWRIQSNLNQTTHTWAQVADAPDGFKYSAKLTVGTGVTPTGGEYGRVYQRIEVQDAEHLQWGTSKPQPITLSFWVKASVTGTYGGTFSGNGNGVYMFAYDVNSANTWEYKTYTVTDGMTTFDTDSNDNGIGFGVHFDLGEGPSRSAAEGPHPTTNSGSMGLTGGVKILATSGATWQITGVQLELGKVATPFEHRSYGEELALCQRYFERQTGIDGIGVSSSASTCYGGALRYNFKRTTPTISIRDSGGTANKITWNTAGVSGENVSSSVTSTTISATRPFTTSTTSARNSFVISVLDIDAEL